MTLPTKGSRSIRVGERRYRWLIRRLPTAAQGMGASMTVAIQSVAPVAGGVLVVDCAVTRPDNWLAPHQTGITPAVVRDIVDEAISRGWHPESPAAFRISYALITDAIGRTTRQRS